MCSLSQMNPGVQFALSDDILANTRQVETWKVCFGAWSLLQLLGTCGLVWPAGQWEITPGRDRNPSWCLSRPGFLILCIVNILNQISFCCGEWFCALWDAKQHPWPLPPDQWSSPFLAPGTSFMEDSMDWGREMFSGWFQVHYIYCTLYFYFYYIFPTSDHQALDPRGWGILP